MQSTYGLLDMSEQLLHEEFLALQFEQLGGICRDIL